MVEHRQNVRRSYDEIEALAVQSEREGGFARRSVLDFQEIHVGDVVLTGDDALEFVLRLNQRMVARGAGKLNEESYRQGREDALNGVRKLLEEI